MTVSMVIPEELRKKYLDRRKRDLGELTAARREGSFEPFQRIGHQLKGNGATYGYLELADLGRRMEEAGDAADGPAADACLAELASWVTKHVS